MLRIDVGRIDRCAVIWRCVLVPAPRRDEAGRLGVVRR